VIDRPSAPPTTHSLFVSIWSEGVPVMRWSEKLAGRIMLTPSLSFLRSLGTMTSVGTQLAADACFQNTAGS
jgi:hypothetical protein